MTIVHGHTQIRLMVECKNHTGGKYNFFYEFMREINFGLNSYTKRQKVVKYKYKFFHAGGFEC
jgi:hypothetical protein